MNPIQLLAEAVYGKGAKARVWRNTVRVETFELGEVLVIRHPLGPEAAKRMAQAAMLAVLGEMAEAEPLSDGWGYPDSGREDFHADG